MDVIQSYVTCSSERQRKIKEEWDAADRSSHMPPTQTEELYLSENDHDQGGHYKSKKHRPNYEDDLSLPWLCEETDPFTAKIRNLEVLKKTHMPTNVKMYDGTGDPEDHLKIFQEETKIERWAMPTWTVSAVKKSGSLVHLVKEIKQGCRQGEQAKAAKKGEAPNKEKATAIFMVQPWQWITRQKVTQSFSAG
ncbi:hypothetical protein Tco_1165319 [Tanacetum coccineum]